MIDPKLMIWVEILNFIKKKSTKKEAEKNYVNRNDVAVIYSNWRNVHHIFNNYTYPI